MNTRSKKNLRIRATIALYILLFAFVVCVGSLVRVGLIHGEEYKLKAEKNQLLDTKITAERGTIYDSNMNVLAKSASAWLVYIIPSKISDDTQRNLVVEALVSTIGADEESVRAKTEKESNYVKIAGEVEEDRKNALQSFIKEHKDALKSADFYIHFCCKKSAKTSYNSKDFKILSTPYFHYNP